MQYNYKTEKLIQDGVDFKNIYPEKQSVVKEMTGFEFDLENIVNYLKMQTADFKSQIPLAIDIDNAIYSIYMKSLESSGKKVESVPVPVPSETEITDEMNIEAIDFMIELLPDLEGKMKKETIEAIEFINELLPDNKVVKIPKKLLK